MTDHEAAETLREMANDEVYKADVARLTIERFQLVDVALRREQDNIATHEQRRAALDVALQAIGIVERLAKTDHPWEYRGGPTNERECCFFCGVERELIEHPNGRDHEDDCLWLAARAVCPGPPEER